MNSQASNSTLEPLNFRARQFDVAVLLLLICVFFPFFFFNKLDLILKKATKYWISLFADIKRDVSFSTTGLEKQMRKVK